MRKLFLSVVLSVLAAGVAEAKLRIKSCDYDVLVVQQSYSHRDYHKNNFRLEKVGPSSFRATTPISSFGSLKLNAKIDGNRLIMEVKLGGYSNGPMVHKKVAARLNMDESMWRRYPVAGKVPMVFSNRDARIERFDFACVVGRETFSDLLEDWLYNS